MVKKDKKKKKGGFDPKASELKRVLRHVVAMLKPEEIEKIVSRAGMVAKRHYTEDRLGHPSTWRFYGGKEWLSYGLKEILNVRAGRPIDDYRAGMLTLNNLQELAEFVGIKSSELGDVNRSILWSQIVVKVKQDEDSSINRLKKLWDWLEERLTPEDIEYLMIRAPGFWKNRECYKDPKWRKEHLSYIFEISFIIQEVVDAKMKARSWTNGTPGLSKIQLWVITQRIMGLNLPNYATKEVMWQGILERIAFDKTQAR